MSDCKHNYEHLDTQYLYYSRTFGNPTYKRIDRFYCTECCDLKEIVKEETNCYTPEWFDTKQRRTIHD